jgi:TatD DNase family protein
MRYYDIHTHFEKEIYDELSVINQNFYEYKSLNINQMYSVGLHPWFVDSDFEAQIESLYTLANQPNVVAIGECGLDKIRNKTTIEIQKKAFITQLKLAEQLSIPVIIHCVRAHEEMYQIQKQLKPEIPLIVHGFNQKTAIGLQYLKQGFCLSLGAALLIDGSNAQQILVRMPLKNLFLETDDKAISIKAIYNKAAFLLKIEENDLQKQLEINVKRIFKLEIKT